jgi:hypothetical protein
MTTPNEGDVENERDLIPACKRLEAYDPTKGLEAIASCPLCDPKTAFGHNALVTMAYCPHQRLGAVKPREWGAWHVIRNATAVQFADIAMTVACYNALDPDFWTELVPRGAEGLK